MPDLIRVLIHFVTLLAAVRPVAPPRAPALEQEAAATARYLPLINLKLSWGVQAGRQEQELVRLGIRSSEAAVGAVLRRAQVQQLAAVVETV